MKVSLNICSFGFHELNSLGHVVSGLILGFDKKTKWLKSHRKKWLQNKEEIMSFLGFSIHYMKHLKDFSIHARSLYRIFNKQIVFEMTQESIQEYERIKYALTNAQLLLILDWKIHFKMYIDSCSERLGAALHQVPIVNNKPYEGPISSILGQTKPT
ncbi:hypothetical protein O181_055700 [Austropuccinia psidii MF-1]|uniref:Reverse transcriptase/retrotransposon-derived protein RNase H-like domain-containing protein n=1 Tax=Austropuccinia psidii MF-1 TaxID=1389203 RepID=A0A9Q3E4T1_9BASI|nr:hypothetical protein [Austropuccinia psidii MF-1]